MSLKDDPTTKTDEGEFRVTYEKSSWESGDLRPEHYFACTATGTDGTTIDYNQNYLDGITEKQAIEYDVGLNQTIRVNTTADEVFQHDIGRDVDDMINALEDTISMETTVNKLQSMVDSGSYSGTDLDTLNDQLAAAEKAFTLLKENTQKVFESGISKMQSHLDTVNYAVTQNGTRSQQLELITNRLMNQKTNFETLQSDNEDVDISEVAIQLSSAELTYNAALMATSKILQTNLMNFI
jgi:flagellar hook-associated protein 3 FlgL